jgi:nucleoid-associated protein YgaU
MIEEASKAAQAQGTAAKVESYTVLPNDTLQKISLKVFGTTKKWKNIFDANSDTLKSPDRIYTGQVLKIPQE